MKKLLLLVLLVLLPTHLARAEREPEPKKQDKPAVKQTDKPERNEEAEKPKNLDPSPKNAALKPGTVQRMHYWFTDADKWMEYAVYFPKSYKPEDKQKKYPTIFALHGLGHSAMGILLYPGFAKLAEQHGYILIAPSGHGPAGWYGSRGYELPGTRPKNLGELSEKDVLNVLKLAGRDYPLDENRLYLLGHSMGGGGTLHLAIKDPSPWAGLAPIAPAYYLGPAALTKIRKLPVIMVQGDKDLLVKVTMVRPLAEKMKELKMDVEYIEVPGGGHVTVAFENLPKIFDFFNKRRRATE